MKTQKEIRNKIKELTAAKEALLHNDELGKIQKEYRDKLDAYYKKIRPERDKIDKEIETLRKELNKRKDDKLPIISKLLEDWLSKYTSGVDFGPKGLTIKEVLDEQERFVLISNPGHLYWSGRGETSYGKSTHWIVDTFVCKSWLNSDYSTNGTKRVGSEVEGRLTKEAKKKLLDELEEYKKKNNITG